MIYRLCCLTLILLSAPKLHIQKAWPVFDSFLAKMNLFCKWSFLLFVISAFVLVAYYCYCVNLAGNSWIKSMILTASLFPFMCFGIGFILNTIAIFYGSLAAIPFGTMVVVFVIWAFISFPLALLGTVVGKNWSGAPNNPCRVKTIPRPIPEKKWYLTPSVVSLMGGLLPFGSIFIEMYFVFTSFWNYKVNMTISSIILMEVMRTVFLDYYGDFPYCCTFI